MIWTNTPQRWGVIAKFFHWTVGVLVLFMLALGLYMTSLEIGPRVFSLYALHKSIGMIILSLAVMRLAWKAVTVRPNDLPTHQGWERKLAHLVHGFLYFTIFAMPLSGWIMSSAKNFHVSVFGWFTMPDLVAPNKDLAEFLEDFHDTLAWVVMGALGLHIAGALKHHVIDKDSTLLRMLPFGKIKGDVV